MLGHEQLGEQGLPTTCWECQYRASHIDSKRAARRVCEQIDLRRPQRHNRRITKGHGLAHAGWRIVRENGPDRGAPEVFAEVHKMRGYPSRVEVSMGRRVVGSSGEDLPRFVKGVGVTVREMKLEQADTLDDSNSAGQPSIEKVHFRRGDLDGLGLIQQ